MTTLHRQLQQRHLDCKRFAPAIGYWHQRVDERHGNPPPSGAISGQRQKLKDPQVRLR